MEVINKEYNNTIQELKNSLSKDGKTLVFKIENREGKELEIKAEVVVEEFLKRCKHVGSTLKEVNQSDPVADLMQYNGRV